MIRNKWTSSTFCKLLGIISVLTSNAVLSDVKPSYFAISTGTVQTDNHSFERNSVYSLSIGHQIFYFTMEVGQQSFSEFYLKNTRNVYIDEVSGNFFNIGLALPINANMGVEPYIGIYTWEMKSIRFGLLWKESKGDSAQMGLDYYFQILPEDQKIKLRLKLGIQYMEKLSGPNVTQGQVGVQIHF